MNVAHADRDAPPHPPTLHPLPKRPQGRRRRHPSPHCATARRGRPEAYPKGHPNPQDPKGGAGATPRHTALRRGGGDRRPTRRAATHPPESLTASCEAAGEPPGLQGPTRPPQGRFQAGPDTWVGQLRVDPRRYNTPPISDYIRTVELKIHEHRYDLSIGSKMKIYQWIGKVKGALVRSEAETRSIMYRAHRHSSESQSLFSCASPPPRSSVVGAVGRARAGACLDAWGGQLAASKTTVSLSPCALIGTVRYR